MNTLIIDTSHTCLVTGVAIDSKLVAYKQENVGKRQSEYLITFVSEVLEKANLQSSDIDEVVVTNGPGSYTGMRIGLTFVKTWSLVNTEMKIYTVDTLLSLAGMKDGFSFIDARSKRVFGAYIEKGNVKDERVYTLDELETINQPLFGDLSLVGKETEYGNICSQILEVRDMWNIVENPDLLVPNYLK
ncbi:tRNA (adenosine(37)-N6)-threonylcarbamoyltransferase complex dimerization subunit type 1 TsaB [Erysipelothrix inopinata]|uniref:tRNA (Adenosine(37)-N6)-threonylcarbamoyltransferase complex dimerization subunit type 1 TsaB n=1 Tax=Erysipelothrix inopinata TaxID=225084 RepID=A0A7G9RZ25_9FIRM|nr:tRNA (adenosine(37)-N6)-threonylcarbamoyltransferase complex dimerization subunit type 1 TsaB [Erysipelothrix inopinata]QNN60850.1 tRNA (adenosine(37)-N6)-threonylcarbamoyltransferase complex dimerization subunit type 1 TsaB [Erysipelothrix inopinata]